MRARTVVLAVAVIGTPLLAAGALLAGSALRPAAAAGATPAPPATATIERRTLNATTQVYGTLGYADSYAIANGVTTSGSADPASAIQAFAQAQSAYDQALSSRDALRNPSNAQVAPAQAQLAGVNASLGTAEQAAGGPTAQELDQARAQLAAAKAQLAGAQDAVAGPSPSDLAAAQAQLAQAQAQLVTAQQAAAGPTQAQLAQAQAAVTAASASLAADQAAVGNAEAALSSCNPPRSSAPSGSPLPAAPACDPAALTLALQQAQARVEVDQAQLTAAQAALDALKNPGTQAQAQANIASAEAAVQSAQAHLQSLTSGASAQATAQLASAQAGVSAAQAALDALQHGDRAGARAQLDAARAQVRAARASLDALLHPTASQLKAADDAVSVARAGLDAAQAVIGRPRGVVTHLAPAGATVEPGGILYTLDGAHPVVLMAGDVPAWRRLASGISDGPDVKQLETNLKALGFGSPALKVDRHWDAETTAAVKRWQKSLRVAQDGAIEPGTVVFEPGALRITSDATALGAIVQQGASMMEATSTRRTVAIAMDAADQASVKPGDHVDVQLSDGSTTTGTVASVGSVATQGQNGSSPTVDVTIELDDPAATGTLDQAPVQVAITTDTRADVLAVPVEALVALAEGGYAIELVDAGARRYVRVQLGLFADGWVEITGSGLAEGQTVVVPR